MSTFTFCETLGGTPIGNPGTAPAEGFRIGGAGGPAGGPYVITNNGAPFISGKTYNNSGEFIETILNPPSGLYTLELRENPSLPVTGTWVLTVTNANNLPAAIPRERQNDPTDDPRFIDLALLGKNPLLVIVLTNDSRFQPGDTVNLTYIAKVTGQPDVVVTLSGTVATDQFGQKQPLILQVPNNQVPAGAVVTIDYMLFRGTAPEGQSDTATAQVIGTSLPDLFAPRFQKSIAGNLDPLDPANLQGANAQAEVLDAVPGDTAIMVVQGAPGAGSPTFTAIPFNTNKRANFALTSAFLAANMGKAVNFYYQFIRGNSYNSEELDGSVDRIADHDPRLPLSTIDGNVTSDLDVTTLLPTSEFRLAAWPHQVLGQIGHLRYEGVDTNGSTVFYDDMKGVSLGAGSLVRPVPLTWLQTLKDSSALKLHFSLNYDGVANEQAAVKFPVRSYTVQAQPALVVAFLNAPYTATVGGQVGVIEVLLTQAGQPGAGQTITVTLPQGTMFADGTSTKDFTTELDGRIIVSGVKAGRTAGLFSIIAQSGGATSSAGLEIKTQGGVGPVVVDREPSDVVTSPDDSIIYVACYSTVVLVDAESLQIIKRINLSTHSNKSMALSKNGTRLFVAGLGAPYTITITLLDPTSSVVIKTIDLPREVDFRITLSPDDSLLYVVVGSGIGSASMYTIDVSTLSIRHTLPIPNVDYIYDIKVSNDGNKIIRCDWTGLGFAVIDTKSYAITRIKLPDNTLGYSNSITYDDSKFVVAGYSPAGEIYEYDFPTLTLKKSYNINSGSSHDVKYNYTGELIYVMADKFFLIIDTNTGEILKESETPRGALRFTINCTYNKAFIVCVLVDTLWVVDLAND